MEAVAPHGDRAIHVVLDNLSTHTTPDGRAWLQANPNPQLNIKKLVASNTK